jgi:hypothetical protein
VLKLTEASSREVKRVWRYLTGKPPVTIWRNHVEGCGSVLGVAGFTAAPSMGVFMAVNLPGWLGFLFGGWK